MREHESLNATASVAAVARRQLFVRVARLSVAFVALALIVTGGCGVYRLWRNKHLQQQACAFAAQGDFQSAVLVARHLLQIDHDNFVATRVMADIAERSGSGDAVQWRQRLVALRPLDVESRLGLTATALRFGKLDLAAATVKSIPADRQNSCRYQQLAGAVALAQRQLELAEQCFTRALEYEPKNERIALNLATIQLASSRQGVANAARENLQQLATKTDVRLATLRVLAADALARGSHEEASRWTDALVQEKSAAFSDYLLHLEATVGADNSAAVLDKAKAAAADSAQRAAELITWMNRHELAAGAIAWSKSLDRKVTSAQPVPLAIAESLSCQRDWPALAEFVRDGNWGAHEALRLAIESHATRHLSNSASAEPATLWRAAVRAAQAHPDELAMVAKLAEGWGYFAEAAEALWQVANGTNGAKEALAGLQRIYTRSHDTRGLLRVAKRALELNPNDLVAANNCASLGLLLNSDAGARRIAERLYTEHPANAAFATTYAFALHVDGKTADALRVIERLKEQQLRQPALAAYYVVMLAASGNVERARAFLPVAERANLLPEEQTLLADAARKVKASS